MAGRFYFVNLTYCDFSNLFKYNSVVKRWSKMIFFKSKKTKTNWYSHPKVSRSTGIAIGKKLLGATNQKW